MSAILSDFDRELIEVAKNDEILREIKEDLPDFSNGVIAVFCADGDQFSEKHRHLSYIVREQCGIERVHPLNTNGGALTLAHNSPLADTLYFMGDFARGTLLETMVVPVRQDHTLLFNILGAIKLKEITTIALYVHAPCGAATHALMNFKEVIKCLAQAKKDVKSTFYTYKLKVPCFCHIDYGEKDENGLSKKRTYHIKTGLVDGWLE